MSANAVTYPRVFMLLAAALLSLALPPVAHAADTASQAEPEPSLYTWDEVRAPNYIIEWGKARGASKAPDAGKIVYSKLDKLGRTRIVRGNLTYPMVIKAAERGKQTIPYDTKPSGWGNNKIVKFTLANGIVRSRYFWNRSHLIADSLGGAPKKRNMVTGTRTQNVGANDACGGIAFCECLARVWLYRHHSGSLYYAARPMYKDNELIPRSIIVNMKASDGSLNRRFIVYNTTRGYTIDYTNGKFAKSKAAPITLPIAKPTNKTTAYTTKTGTKYHRIKLCESLAYASTVEKTTCGKAKKAGKQACPDCW